ncbi:hypothetical protein ODJ79_42220 [Actinoplanes sp. KI2]|uniref:hypothetical protein n=1 Tax=Actinoplanes sp. KI2 TaxID=2983315 RepID=UPI0021D5BD2A|nr:hypothetical protein [Actinoplanes sp. KI2]MCU7730375.1 hypothetical protein [Actinoplanes sp. KI2]
MAVRLKVADGTSAAVPASVALLAAPSPPGPSHYAAAPASSVPILTIVVAVLGILGTLAATWLTNYFNSKRDERQWRWQKQLQDERIDRDRQQEALRWQREREERREQWDREDSRRWNSELVTVYSELVSSLIQWTQTAKVLLSADYDLDGALIVERSVLDELESLRASVLAATRRVELWATEGVRDAAWLAVAMCGQFGRAAGMALGRSSPDFDISQALGPPFDAVEGALQKIQRAIRVDLRIATDGDENPATSTQ